MKGTIIRRFNCLGFVLLLTLVAAAPAQAQEADKLWQALAAPGHFALMRHASAPGIGDPANFKLGDCSTQRNLSEEGRAQARAAGALFRRHGINAARVYSSQWCRCLETARLLELGDVSELASLNSFFGRREQAGPQIEELRRAIAGLDLAKPAVLVTHQVVISALAGVPAASGEIVILRRNEDGALSVLGSVRPQ